MGSFVLKTIRRFAHAGDDPGECQSDAQVYDIEDERSGPRLLMRQAHQQ